MHRPTARPFGLTEQSWYIYGGWRDESGALHIVERKFCGPMTAGLWMMTTRSGKVSLAPESLQTVRGEVDVNIPARASPARIVARQGRRSAGGRARLRLTPGAMQWREGSILELEGPWWALEFRSGARPRQTVLLHQRVVQGSRHRLGREGAGFVFLDHGYWPHGQDWKEWRIFNGTQLSWSAFATEFANGQVEWGQVAIGRGGSTSSQ